MKSLVKRRTWRSKRYLRFVRRWPCMHCGKESTEDEPSAAHHWHEAMGGTALKCPDWATVPLCYMCHNAGFHQAGTLPGLTPEITRQDFIREQRRLMALWLERDGETAQDPF